MLVFERLFAAAVDFSKDLGRGYLLSNKVKRLSRIFVDEFRTAEDAAGYVFWRHSLVFGVGFWGWVIRAPTGAPGYLERFLEENRTR